MTSKQIERRQFNSNRYKSLTKGDLLSITGGRKLDYIECIGHVDENGVYVPEGTIRHYITTIFGKEIKSTGADKPGDVGNC